MIEKSEKIEKLEQTGNTIKELVKEVSQKRSINRYFGEHPERATAMAVLIGIVALFFSAHLIRLIMSGTAVVLRIAVMAYTVRKALRFLPKFGKKC